jgi:V/A-type H+-transporting ATPase subunit F
MKVFVIGNQEAVLGFSLVGVAGTVAATAAEANLALDEALANSQAGIVLVTEDVAGLIEARMDHLKLRSTVPLVVEIPGPGGVRADRPSLNDIMLRAIGVKL